MAEWWLFRVVAHLTDGRSIVTPLPWGSLAARDPESAARKWYWRLSGDQRVLVDRVIVFSPPTDTGMTLKWAGPTIVYRPVEGRLVEVERRG